MKTLILKSIFALLIICSFSHFTYSQDLRKQAEENPLSTVFYLLSTTDKDSKSDQKACLAKSLVSANRIDEIENVANMVEKESYVDEEFVALANDLITKGKINEASKLVTFLMNKFGDDEYRLQMILKPLVRLKKDQDALQLIGKFDTDKIDGAFELAKVYLDLGQPTKALDVIEMIKNLVENSKYDEDKVKLGLFYAKLGKEQEALKFLQESMKNLVWKSGKPEYTEGRIIDRVVEIYRTLGKNEEATQLLTRQGIIEETKSQFEIAENYLAKGNIAKAKELLEKLLKRLNPNEYWDGFDLGKLVEIYLKLGEVKKSEHIVKSLADNNHARHRQLLNIADFYIKKKNKSKASEILIFALEQTKKIDISKEESGLLSTSGKWQQAQYQSQIVIRLIDMQFDKQALQLISQITKPYLKALILTEYVSVNKKRIPAKKLSFYLEEALSFLRQKKVDIFDSKKFDVFAITARNFAEIGMNEKSNEVFAEALSTLDKKMIESGSDNSLLFAMCNIGVEFDNSKIKPNEKLKESLRNIIKNWENDAY